jgi:hypothetical protein
MRPRCDDQLTRADIPLERRVSVLGQPGAAMTLVARHGQFAWTLVAWRLGDRTRSPFTTWAATHRGPGSRRRWTPI